MDIAEKRRIGVVEANYNDGKIITKEVEYHDFTSAHILARELAKCSIFKQQHCWIAWAMENGIADSIGCLT